MNERDLFTAALQIEDPAGRSAFIVNACGGDTELCQRVEALLAAHSQAGSFLQQPAAEEFANQTRGLDTQGEMPVDDGNGEALSFLASSDQPDSLGRLNHYEIKEVIGRGGMGVVLRAFDNKLHRVVAIKVMAAQLATNGTARRRFTREAQAQAAVSHDHIVAIYAVEEAGGLPYLVMQYVSGMSLQERLDRGGPLELHEILRIGMQTAGGLVAAHAQGLIHRDIKPSNILLENGVERVKVTDFGLARAAADASLTQSGVVAGTPQYMSPEQAEGNAIDQRTDLFSLGSMLYAMCTGRPPFRASTTVAVLKRVCEETPTPIRETNPEIPDWLVAIIAKLHAKALAERYQSAAEVADVLSRCLAHVQHPSVAALPLVSPTGKGTGRERWRGWRRWAVAATIGLCLLAGVLLTEATGVTNLRATLSRLFTPEADPDRRAAEWVLSIGGTIKIKENGTERQIGAVGDLPRGAFQLTIVNLERNPQVSDAGLAHFNDCKNLTWLNLAFTQVGAAGLAHFRDRKNLTYLELHSAQVSDAGLANFKDCSNLLVLGLADTQVSDAGLANFKHCKNLSYLDLADTQVGDVGLANFKYCKNLLTLNLRDTRVSDAGLAHFKNCKNLLFLHLADTQVSDTGLAYFKDCKTLKYLELHSTQVSDVGLAPFKDCKNLGLLTLQKTKVTASGIDELKKALPKCKIEWDGGVIEPQAAVPKAEANAFVLLAAKGVLERKFDTLAEAVLTASDGDIIEVRGNGPFVSHAVSTKKNALTIRAGEGFRPVIRLSPQGVDQQQTLISTAGPLVLEGLELQRLEQRPPKDRRFWKAMVLAQGPSLHMANCRLLQPAQYTCIHSHCLVCELRNCEILSGVEGGSAVTAQCHSMGRFVMTNCLQAGGGLILHYDRPDVSGFPIRLTHNTLVEEQWPCLALAFETDPKRSDGTKPFRVEASGNILDSPTGPLRVEHRQAKLRPPGDAVAWLPRLVAWEAEGNLYSVEGPYVLLGIDWGVGERLTAIKSLKDWKQLWASAEKESLEGRARYQGGDLGSRLAVEPEKLTPLDFRLRADSPGYRAGKDEKDLGADVNLVGPGPAFERWKKTHEYQQWRMDTGQVKK